MDIYQKRKKLDKKIRKYCINYIRQIEKPIFVEVGAYGGNFIKELHVVNPDLQALAIEPNPEMMEKLKQNTRHVNCEYWQNGVGKRDELYQSSKGSKSGCTTFYKNAKKDYAEVVKTIDIECLPVSKMVAHLPHIDLLSINCEGGEYEMFDDNLEFLQKTKAIAIAMHTKSKQFQQHDFLVKRRDIVDLLKNFEFHMVMGVKDLKFKAHVVQLWVK